MELRIGPEGLIPVEDVLRALGMEGREMRRLGEEFPDLISFHRRGMESYLDTLSFVRLHMIWWWHKNGFSPQEIRSRLSWPPTDGSSWQFSNGPGSPADSSVHLAPLARASGAPVDAGASDPGAAPSPAGAGDSGSRTALCPACTGAYEEPEPTLREREEEKPEELKVALLRARQEVRRLRRELELLRSRRPRFLGIF